MAKRKTAAVKVERGSGNVFADLNLPDAIELDTKAHLIVGINRVIEARKLTQAEAAKILGVNQPKVSALKNYRVDGFSIERLLGFLQALGQDIEIRIRPRSSARSAGKITVEAG